MRPRQNSNAQQQARQPYKTGYRTCYNCHTHGNCKLLQLQGVNEASMFNKCPDISPIKEAVQNRRK